MTQGIGWIDPETLHPVTAFGAEGMSIEDLAASAVPEGVAYEVIDKTTVEQWRNDHASAAELVRQHNAPIIAELDEIDRKSARALRAIVAGTETDDDRARLTELNAQAETLRAQLQQEVD